ncbi:MAG: 3D domain-containing protein [Sarcina sp.]
MGDKLKYLRDHFFDSPKKKVMAIITGLTIVGVGIGTSIIYKPVKIQIGEMAIETSTMMGTVQDVLDKNNIILDQKDKIVPSLESKLSKNSIINITKAQDVIVLVDGKELSIKSAEETIEDMLIAEQIILDEDDRVEPDAQTKIEDGQKVEIVRIDEELITENENIDFEVTVKKNKDLDKSVKKTVQEGEVGQKEIILKVIYENGQEVQRDIISEKITKDPIAKVIEEGTRESYVSISRGSTAEVLETVTTNQSQTQNTTGKTIAMESTAYYTGSITATGTTPKRNPDGISTVAVDPRVIPLGSKLYIDGYGYAIAEDTGGAIKNNIIDVFLNSKEECINWGRRNVQVTIVAYPGQW